MLTEKELELRRKTLGSSEIGVIAGHSIYRNLSPMTIWTSKVFGPEQTTSASMSAGAHFEAGIAEWYADEVGLEGRRMYKMRRRVHPRNRWMSATCDYGIARHKRRGRGTIERIVECKYVGPGMDRHWDTESLTGIPAYVDDQVRWQMACTGIGAAHVAAYLAGPREFRIWEVERDIDRERALIEIGKEFWSRYVVPKQAPLYDGSEAAARYLADQFRMVRAENIPAPLEAEELAMRYVAAREAEAEASAEKEHVRQQLCALIGEAAGIVGSWGAATWRTESKGRLDKEALLKYLLAKEPEGVRENLEEQFRKQPIRVFRLTTSS